MRKSLLLIIALFWIGIAAKAQSTAAEILTFDIPGQVSSTVNATAGTVYVVMPVGTNVTALVPTITISALATISPLSGVAQDFTSSVTYTVTAEDAITTKDWEVTVGTLLFSDDFESYTTDGFLVGQVAPSTWWTTWTNSPSGADDTKISEDHAHSGIKSVIVPNANPDIILKLGNKTSGKFNVSFWYYIPTGFGGYFNMQHYQSPGIQWATEVYFGNNGAGNIQAQGITTNFTHTLDTWIHVENIVDINMDSAWFYLDGVKIVAWKFSTKADGTAGAAQLGGIDFYGGAITGQTPKYYFDDVTFAQLAQPLDPPTINLSTTTITTDGLAPESFTISNVGQENMTFVAYPTYPYAANNVANATSPVDITYISSTYNGGLGGFTVPVTVRAASKFDPAKLNSAIGQEIYSVLVAINDITATNTSLLIYDRGSYITPGPGTLLANIPFTATSAGSVIEVTLTSPIYVDGKDLWIGYTCDAPATTYPLGLDAGPRVSGANWISTGVGWSEYNSTVDANLFISANVQGSSIKQWLTVTPTSGTILPAQNQSIGLTFDITGLPNGNYTSVVEIGSNDPSQEYSEVTVNLTVVTSIENNENSIGIMTYPNPATQNVNIKSNSTIENIVLFNMTGQLVKNVNVNASSATLDVNNLSKGSYLMEIHSGSNIVKRNIVIK